MSLLPQSFLTAMVAEVLWPMMADRGHPTAAVTVTAAATTAITTSAATAVTTAANTKYYEFAWVV